MADGRIQDRGSEERAEERVLRITATPRAQLLACAITSRASFIARLRRAARPADVGTSNDGPRLPVLDKQRIDDGVPVTWVVPGECVSLSWDPDGTGHAFEATLVESVPLGDVTQCVVELVVPPCPRVVVTLPTQALRTRPSNPGARVFLTLDSDGIHIMPVKHRPHA